MKLGDSGSNVAALQSALGSKGYKIVVDGSFGPATEKAVKDFQKANGLDSDGIAGPATMAKLNPVIQTIVVEGLDSRTQKYFNTLDPKAQKIFLPFILEAKKIAAEMGFDYIAISGNRTPKEQEILYAKGRTSPGAIVTNARPYQSNHQYGIALDFGVFKNGIYMDEKSPDTAANVHKEISRIINKYGIEWGGVWKIKDHPHFEIKTGLSLQQKKERLIKSGTVL